MYGRFGSAGGDRAKRRARGRSADSRRSGVARGGDGDNTRSQHPISHAVQQVAPGKQSRATEAHVDRSEEHTSELQSLAYLVCRLLLEKKKKTTKTPSHTIRTETYNY